MYCSSDGVTLKGLHLQLRFTVAILGLHKQQQQQKQHVASVCRMYPYALKKLI